MDTADIRVPEVVRPVVLEKAVEQLEKKGLRYSKSEAKDEPTWEQARAVTQQMVNESLQHPNMQCEEYAQMIGMQEQMKEATRKYAEWSAAAEIRMLAAERIKIHKPVSYTHLTLPTKRIV